ncbi:MAG: hypothetical protein ACT6RL_19850 [Neoaquamicrobium sediminum]|uniref:hypothetical protein n=1 Tax=Neoaquamicrobium sediminum TaxID=1849104 RepID=UPI004035E62A
MNYWILEKTIYADFNAEDDPVHFRIEALRARDMKRYKVKLYRLELFRVTPTFGDFPEGGADHSFYVSSEFFEDEELYCDDAAGAFEIVLSRLRDMGFRQD